MFHRRKEGEELHWGFNYEFDFVRRNKGGVLLDDNWSVAEISLVIPIPIFVFRGYTDIWRMIKYKCWQYYTVYFYFRIGRVKIRPTIIFDIKTYLKPVKEMNDFEFHRIMEERAYFKLMKLLPRGNVSVLFKVPIEVLARVVGRKVK